MNQPFSIVVVKKEGARPWIRSAEVREWYAASFGAQRRVNVAFVALSIAVASVVVLSLFRFC